MSPAITHLGILLAEAQPSLNDGEFVFLPLTETADWAQFEPVCMFREREGVTVICRRERADAAGLTYSNTYRQITLTVHSSLEAVGFLAAIAGALMKAGIPSNVVSAYYHDHLFVPCARATETLNVLHALSREARGDSGLS